MCHVLYTVMSDTLHDSADLAQGAEAGQEAGGVGAAAHADQSAAAGGTAFARTPAARAARPESQPDRLDVRQLPGAAVSFPYLCLQLYLI